MKRRFKFYQSIYVKIPLLFLMILLIAFQVIAVLFTRQLEDQSVSQFKSTTNIQVGFLASNVTSILTDDFADADEKQERINQTLSTYNSMDRTNIKVIDTDEYIIGSNYVSQTSSVGTKVNEDRVKGVLINQRSFVEESYDYNTQQHTYTVIRPLIGHQADEVLGVLYIEADMNRVYDETRSIMKVFMQSVLIAIIICTLVSISLSQGLTQPIEKIRQQAVRIAKGNYDQPVEVNGQDELSELAETVNELAEKVKTSQESTEAERQRLEGVLRHMTDGVISTDRYGQVMLVNDKALSLLDVTREEVLGQPIIDLLGLPKETRIRDLLEDSEGILIDREDGFFNTILRGKFSVVRRETGFTSGMVCVLTDVTEQEKTERERREFVSNVSHELRTPLTSVKSYADTLLEGAWESPDIAPKFIGVIADEADRMYRMVDNLLNLSKIQDGKIDLKLELVDFKAFVNSIVERYRFMLENDEQYKDENITIETEFTSRDIYVEIDPDWMVQVIDNIFNNAIKYSPDGGNILVKITETHHTLTLTITDQGMGIAQNHLEHIFDRFYRVDKARSREKGGTGLGLAISKEILELHNGNLWVKSVEDHGSTFGIDLQFNQDNILEKYPEFDDWGSEL